MENDNYDERPYVLMSIQWLNHLVAREIENSVLSENSEKKHEMKKNIPWAASL